MRNQLSAAVAAALGLIPAAVYAEVNTSSAAYQMGQNLGRVFGLVFLAVIAYKVVQWLRRK